MKITLQRDAAQAYSYCTLGTLTAAELVLPTVERPWIPVPDGVCGHQQTSCIGVGNYVLNQRTTETRGRHWIISNPALGVYRYPQDIPAGVYARSLVLIHAANWAHELLGCIAPGLTRAMIAGEMGVTSSQVAMDLLRAKLWNETNLVMEVL